jgi:DNA-binding IclR family transcriptional regulator
MDTTAVKSLRALEWLCLRETPTGVTEMSVALGVAKSNAHRILTTLAALGFVRPVADGRYEATLKTWEIGSAVLTRFDIRDIARPVMLALSARCGETVHLSVLEGGDVVYIDKVEGSHPVRAYSRVGGRAPAYAVATGKALLAFREDMAEALPALKSFTPHTLRSKPALLKELAEVRQRGYAANTGEWRQDVGGIGAPIRNDRGDVVAAVGISGPTARLTTERMRALTPSVIAAANDISHAYGYREARNPHMPPARVHQDIGRRRAGVRKQQAR